MHDHEFVGNKVSNLSIVSLHIEIQSWLVVLLNGL